MTRQVRISVLAVVAIVALFVVACTPAAPAPTQPAPPPAEKPAQPAKPEAKPAEKPAEKPVAKVEEKPAQPKPAARMPDAPPANPDARPGGTLIHAISRDLAHANPFFNTQSVGQYIKQTVWEPLIAHDLRGNLQPMLAESWEVSPDATTFTFYLRRGVKFHDGQEMTADDVIWSAEYVLNPEHAATGFGRLNQVDSVDKLDDYTVRFTLRFPSVAFLSLLGEVRALPIVPANSLQQGQIEVGDSPPPGTGPFKFVEYIPNTSTVVERWDDYWGRNAYLDRVIFQLVPDATVRFTALRAGDVQTAERIPLSWIPRVRAGEVPGIEVYSATDSGLRRLAINHQSPLLQDRRLREALAYSMDRDEMLEEVFEGLGTPVNVKMPPGSEWHALAPEPRPKDLERASQLMQEAGYQGQEINVISRRGHETFAEYVERALREAGFNVRVEVLESAVNEEREARGQFDLSTSGGGLDPDPSVSMKAFFMCEEAELRSDNESGYCNPEVDRLFEQLEVEVDPEQRKEVFRELAQLLHDDVAWIYFGTEPRYFAWTDNVQDFQPGGDGSYQNVWEGLSRAWLRQ